jgi:CBS domain-containing protein
VARFQGMFPSAGAEFRIAVAGPLVSLALGGAFVGGALVGLPEALDAICAWLGWINLALLVFNLLPALPLDGGRMLRAALWQWKGDLNNATRLAAGAGRILSITMIAAGVVLTAVSGLVSGLWLAFIGWFLLQAATAEARYVASPLRTLRVRDMMVADPITVSPAQTLEEVSDEILWRSRHTAYPVVRDGVAVGLLPAHSLDDVDRPAWARERVADHMAPIGSVPAIGPDDELPAAVAALQEGRLQRALVIEGERLVGMLSVDDVARALGVEGASIRA